MMEANGNEQDEWQRFISTGFKVVACAEAIHEVLYTNGVPEASAKQIAAIAAGRASLAVAAFSNDEVRREADRKAMAKERAVRYIANRWLIDHMEKWEAEHIALEVFEYVAEALEGNNVNA